MVTMLHASHAWKLDVQELRSGLVQLKHSLSNHGLVIEDCRDFDMECLRECLLFVQPLWCDCKRHAVCLAVLIGALTCWRLHLSGAELQSPRWQDLLKYDTNFEIECALSKLRNFQGNDDMFAFKAMEITASMKFLELMMTCKFPEKLGVSVVGCHAILADSLKHIHAFLRQSN